MTHRTLIAAMVLALTASPAAAKPHHRARSPGDDAKPAEVSAPAAKKGDAKGDAKGDGDEGGDDEGAGGNTRTLKGGKEKVFDFTGLELDGTVRMPQLLYFLERAQQELERASLKRRSFIPEMVRSLDEEAL